MLTLTPTTAALLALICGAWLAAAIWATLRGMREAGSAGASLAVSRYSEALLSVSPAVAAVVQSNRVVAADDRLHRMLGLDQAAVTIAELSTATAGLTLGDADRLKQQVSATAASGAAFSLTVSARGSSRVLLVRGAPAPLPFAPGTVLLWFLDATEAEERTADLRLQADRTTTALETLSALIEAAPFPMWHRGPDLRLAMVNSAYVAAVEADNALAVIKAGIELVDETDGRSPLSQAAAVRERGEPVARVVPATVAGERRMMRVVEVPAGETGVGGYAIDVEDLEQAHSELTRFVRAQRDMLDRLSAGVAQFGRDRGLIFYNQPFARMFSLRTDFLSDAPEFNRLLDAMREAGNLPEVRDYPEWKSSKGQWFTSGLSADEEDWLLPGGKHLRVVGQPLPDGGLLLIFEDRTEQIQLASARDTLLRVRTATLDNLFEAIGVFASDGRLHLWNNRFRETWQFEEEQLAAHPRVDALTPLIAKKLKNPGHATIVRELVRSATVERKQRSGHVSFTDGRDFQFAAVPLPDGNALFTMLDVTDSRRIEAALRDRNEALEDADRMKTAFVSNMSYELRTPLTSIAGFAEMLANGYAGELSATALDYVRAVLDSVGRLSLLIDNVLDLTQSDTGSLLLAEERVDLGEICHEAAKRGQSLAGRKQVEFAIDVDASLGAIVGDRRRLQQALDNIVENAFAFTPAGGRVLLHGVGDGAAAVITVSDSGVGIAPADQARVFDRFYRAMVAGEGRGEALGLGLPLARQFVEAHGGTVELQSEVGIGTTVTIRLPRTSA